jgi:hypothetical protein
MRENDLQLGEILRDVVEIGHGHSLGRALERASAE